MEDLGTAAISGTEKSLRESKLEAADMKTTDEIIHEAWQDGVIRANQKRNGIGDVTESLDVIVPLIYVFAQLGEPSCVRAMSGGRHDREG